MFNGKLRQRLQQRPFLAQRQRRFGQGQRLAKAQERVNQMTQKIKERQPGILPQVEEKLTGWQPGSRVSELIPKLAKPEPAESPAPAPKRKKLIGQAQRQEDTGSVPDISLTF